MYVNFSEQLAIDFDLEVEYFLRNLVYWLCFNAAKDNPENRNLREGLYWSYNSYPEYAKLIPVLTQKQIRTVAGRAIKGGLLQVNNFNHKKYDNTNWYTLTVKGWEYFEREAKKLYPHWFADINKPDEELNTPAQTGRDPCPNGQTYTNTSTSLSSINTTTSDNSKISYQEVVDAYHEVLPGSPKIKVIGNELMKQIRSMVKLWPKYQKDGKSFSIESFKDYLNYVKNHYNWFIQPYVTENGKKKQNNLTNFTREKNLVRIVNGEFSAS